MTVVLGVCPACREVRHASPCIDCGTETVQTAFDERREREAMLDERVLAEHDRWDEMRGAA